MVGESIFEGFRSSRALRPQYSIPGHLRKKIGFQELVKGFSEPFARKPSTESRESVRPRNGGQMAGESIFEDFRSSKALRAQYSIPGHLRKKIGFQDKERELRAIVPAAKNKIARVGVVEN